VPKQTIQNYQIRVYMNARDLGLSQTDAASIAEFSQRTGQRIEAGEHQPNRGRVRDWRTSADPLAGVWEEELEPMLQREPRLKPMTLFEYLQERYPGQYPQVLRTVQRRVRTWKALHGEAPEVMFELRHEAGVMGISDFTELKGVEITISGKPFEHLLYHYRLAYSGWRYAQVIQGVRASSPCLKVFRMRCLPVAEPRANIAPIVSVPPIVIPAVKVANR
jgi:hypothetical protein